MSNLEEAIRERAYHLWIADGQPEGKADIHWLNAQREILATSVESLASSAAATKPNKRASCGRKSKTAAAYSMRARLGRPRKKRATETRC